MTTKKQRRQQVAENRARRNEENRAVGLAAQRRARERREARREEREFEAQRRANREAMRKVHREEENMFDLGEFLGEVDDV